MGTQNSKVANWEIRNNQKSPFSKFGISNHVIIYFQKICIATIITFSPVVDWKRLESWFCVWAIFCINLSVLADILYLHSWSSGYGDVHLLCKIKFKRLLNKLTSPILNSRKSIRSSGSSEILSSNLKNTTAALSVLLQILCEALPTVIQHFKSPLFDMKEVHVLVYLLALATLGVKSSKPLIKLSQTFFW